MRTNIQHSKEQLVLCKEFDGLAATKLTEALLVLDGAYAAYERNNYFNDIIALQDADPTAHVALESVVIAIAFAIESISLVLEASYLPDD